jgi:hypothetical protein
MREYCQTSEFTDSRPWKLPYRMWPISGLGLHERGVKGGAEKSHFVPALATRTQSAREQTGSGSVRNLERFLNRKTPYYSPWRSFTLGEEGRFSSFAGGDRTVRLFAANGAPSVVQSDLENASAGQTSDAKGAGRVSHTLEGNPGSRPIVEHVSAKDGGALLDLNQWPLAPHSRKVVACLCRWQPGDPSTASLP